MNELQIMNIGGVECYEKGGTAYLKLQAVARGLGFTQIAASGHEVVRWERVRKYLSEFGVPTCGDDSYIPENVFYRLAMKAKNETAEKFQAFVADEVIPSIRKHGAYMTPQTIEQALLNPDTIIKLATQLKAEQEARRALEAKAEADAPKVLFAEAVSSAKTSILIGEMAKLLKQNGVDIGQNRLFAWLRDNGYLIRRKGADFNMPSQYSMERGLFEIKETAITKPDGCTIVSRTPKVTGKGQVFFTNLFLSETA